MGAANIAEIALRLMREGLPGALPVLAVSCVTTPRESRMVSRLDRMGVDIAQAPMRAPVLFVIGHVVSLYRPEALPLDDVAVEAMVLAGE
jgi:uroporphyrin-III C-methyltransferase